MNKIIVPPLKTDEEIIILQENETDRVGGAMDMRDAMTPYRTALVAAVEALEKSYCNCIKTPDSCYKCASLIKIESILKEMK